MSGRIVKTQVTGNEVLVTVEIDEVYPAYQYKRDGKDRIVACTPEHLRSTMNPDSWVRKQTPDIKFGQEIRKGTATVSINLTAFINQANKAARNVNKTAKTGALKAKFVGIRKFHQVED